MCCAVQSILTKAGRASALGSLEENDPDAADDEEDEEDENDDEAGKAAQSDTVVDKLTDLLGKAGITSS